MAVVVEVNVSQNNRNAQVIVEGPSIADVLSAPARELAAREASKAGMGRVGLSGSSGPYPVDQQGKLFTPNPEEPAKSHSGLKYRCDYEITASQ